MVMVNDKIINMVYRVSHSIQGSYSNGKALKMHGRKSCYEKVMEKRQTNNVMEIENILKKSWNFSTARITH